MCVWIVPLIGNPQKKMGKSSTLKVTNYILARNSPEWIEANPVAAFFIHPDRKDTDEIHQRVQVVERLRLPLVPLPLRFFIG